MSSSNRRPAALKIVFPALAFLVAVIVAVRPILNNFADQRVGDVQELDFALAIYYPVRAVLDGSNPYDKSLYLARYPVRAAFGPYLPSTLLIHLPFGLMPLETSRIAFLILTVCLILLLAVVSLRFGGVKASASHVLVVAALIVLSRSGRQVLWLGQLTIEAVLVSYVALYYARTAPRVSGLALGLALSKLNYGLPLALILLMLGQVRPLAYAAVCVLLLNLPVAAVLVHHAGGIHAFVHQLSASAREFQYMAPGADPVTSPYRVDAVALVARFVGHPPGLAGQLLIAFTILGLAAFACRGLAYDDDAVGLWSAIICLAVLLCGYHPAYDLLLLTFPFVWVARTRSPLLGPVGRRVSLLLLAFLAFNYTASDSVFRRLGFLIGSDTGFEALVRTPQATALGSLNGLALLGLFSSLVVSSLTFCRPSSPLQAHQTSA